LSLYLTVKRECSSLYKSDISFLNTITHASRFEIENAVDISVTRFDDISHTFSNINFLKLDTRGTEYELLEGFGDYINNTSVVVGEVEFIPMCVSQKLFKDIYTLFSRRQYFYIYRIYKYSSLR
jgi:hypothetical protein